MLQIEARLVNASDRERQPGAQVTLLTNDREQSLTLPQKPDGRGLAANGGELLCLALASCFCNDLHREATPRAITVTRVEVTVRSVFGGAGEPARELAYSVRVWGEASESELRELVAHTDRVAEVHDTLRRGMPVTLERIEVQSPDAAHPGEVAV